MSGPNTAREDPGFQRDMPITPVLGPLGSSRKGRQHGDGPLLPESLFQSIGPEFRLGRRNLSILGISRLRGVTRLLSQ